MSYTLGDTQTTTRTHKRDTITRLPRRQQREIHLSSVVKSLGIILAGIKCTVNNTDYMIVFLRFFSSARTNSFQKATRRKKKDVKKKRGGGYTRVTQQ